MRALLIFSSVLFSLALAPPLNSEPQLPRVLQRAQARDRVCVYQDIHYAGWEQCFSPGDELANLRDRNNAISSIRVYGRARITVYEDTNFRGRSVDFVADLPDLGLRNLSGSRTWSDHIRSVRVSLDEFWRGPTGQSSREPISNGICVYERRDYEGRSQCWNVGEEVSDLARAGNWSDRISSIRVFGRTVAVVYRDISFRGESILVDNDIPDLGEISASTFDNWDRQISSLVVEEERGRGLGRGRGRGRGRR